MTRRDAVAAYVRSARACHLAMREWDTAGFPALAAIKRRDRADYLERARAARRPY